MNFSEFRLRECTETMFGLDVRVLVGLVLAYGLFAIVGLFWFYTDVEERFGLTAGCLSLLIYFICFPVFPLLLLAYWLMTVAQDRAAKVQVMQEPKAYFASEVTRREAATDTEGAPRPDAPLAAEEAAAIEAPAAVEEPVPELDELIARGELEAALNRAEELLETARAFKDTAGAAKFGKYVRVIRARMRG